MKKDFNLRYEPTQFSNREAAFRWANNSLKPSVVMLGLNDKFWVVCFADGMKLEKLGFELAA